MAFKRHKENGNGLNVPNWIIEPDAGHQAMPVGSNTDLAASGGASSQTPFPLQSHNSSSFKMQQQPQLPVPIHKKVAFDGPSQWPAGGHVPMGLKRKADKKDKKKNKKKDKNKDLKISGPIGNVLHVGMQGTVLPTGPPVSTSAVGSREHTVGENWILGPKLPTAFPSSPPDKLPPRPTGLPPPPPSQASPPFPTAHSPPPPSTPTQFTHHQLGAPSGHSPALPGTGRPATPISSPHAGSNQAGYSLDPADERSLPADNRSSGSSGSKNTKAGKAGVEAEIKRTMKASKIQRDVDILNHVLDDLERFMSTLKAKAAAWAELEKKSKKSRRKKNDAALEALRQRAEPPTEQEFIVTYAKCKYGINLISKLGHHLSSPTPTQLLKGFFVYIREMVNLNNGTQLAASIMSPLFTKAAFDLMRNKLESRNQALWGELGGNWLITADQWPPTRSPPPEYEIEFSDGCVPPNLHNSSDCPSNFPTLDTLPREKRSQDYSEAYDGDQADGKASGGLMISPAIISLMGATPKPRKNSVTDISPGGLVAARSQQSLHSNSSLENETRKAKVIFDYSATAFGELSVYRGETVEVLEEQSPIQWQVKNKFGGIGIIPAQVVELVVRKKKSEARPSDDTTINLHGRNVPAPPKMTPPPIPGSSPPGMINHPQMSNVKYGNKASPAHARKVSQQPQNMLFTVPEDSESRTSTISRPQPSSLGSPPPFSPTPPSQQGFNFMSPTSPLPPGSPPGMQPPPPPPPGPGAPPPPPGMGAPPPPPPPPPVVVPKQPESLAEMIQKNKEKMGQKPQKNVGAKKGEFDITEALSKRKPLRKTSTALVMMTEEAPDVSDMNSELKAKLLIRKNSSGQAIGEDYQVLPWKATISEMKKWLIAQGYGSCAEKVTCKKGEELYQKTRDQLREMLGSSDAVRLFSQLQADKAKAQKEGGVEKISEFQRLMQARKTAADEAEGPTLKKGWGGSRSVQQQDPGNEEQVPAWKQKLRTRLAEKETVFDDTMPRGPRVARRDMGTKGWQGGRPDTRKEDRYSRDYSDEDRRGGRKWSEDRGGRRRRYSDEEDERRGDRRGRKHSEQRGRHRSGSRYSDDERRHDRYSDDEQGSRRHRRGRKDSDNHDDDRRGKKKKNRKSSVYSDDEGYKSRRRRDKKRDDSYSDYDSEYEKKKDKKRKKKGKKKPTNIDDYDEVDYQSESSYTSSSESDSSSDSDSSDAEKKKAADYASTAWALTGVDPNDSEKMSERIKTQQAKIKKELASFSELQKDTGNKTLAPELQKMLQQDLQKLEQLQMMLRTNQGNQSLQTQLLGQQVLLSEHLTEAMDSIKPEDPPKVVESKDPPKATQPSPSPPAAGLPSVISTPADYRMHMLQQRALAAEHQIHAMAAEQQMQVLAAEQQRQMVMAEQQRQMQMQMAAMQSPFASPQQPAFGMNTMSPMYSPYSNPVGYF